MISEGEREREISRGIIRLTLPNVTRGCVGFPKWITKRIFAGVTSQVFNGA